MKKIFLVVLFFSIPSLYLFSTDFGSSTGGVSKIIAGSGVTIDPVDGKGKVTIYFSTEQVTAPGDNLGNHIATTSLDMSNFDITNVDLINASSGEFTGDSFSIGGSTFVTTLGKVGIGTQSPYSNLNIVGTNSLILSVSSTPINGFEYLVVDNLGKVGISTNSPSEKLEIVDGNIKLTNPGQNGVISIKDSNDIIDIFLNTGGDTYLKGGNVGIGTSTVTTTFDVLGKIRWTDAQFVDEMWNGIRPEWTTDETSGSKSSQSKDNGWYRFTTGTTTGDEESIDWNDIVTFTNTKHPLVEFRLQLEEISDTEIEIGLKESESVGTDDYILIGFDPSAQNTWYLQVSSAASTTTDQGFVANTDETLIRFQFNSDFEVEWFINGISQGSISTNIPTVSLQPFIRIRTETDAAHYIEIDFLKIWSNRI